MFFKDAHEIGRVVLGFLKRLVVFGFDVKGGEGPQEGDHDQTKTRRGV